MSIRVALFPVKGGTGKTTLALALAGAAALRGLRVLVVDQEARTSRAAQSLLEGERPSMGEVLPGRGSWYGLRVMRWDGETPIPDEEADVTLIDCPADPDRASAAAEVADVVLLPVQPEPFSVGGLQDAHAALRPEDRAKALVIVNGYDVRERLHRDELDAIEQQLGALMVPGGIVPRRAAIPRAQAAGAPLQLSSTRGLEDTLPVIEVVLDAALAKGAK